MNEDRQLVLSEMEEKIDRIFSAVESLRASGTSGKSSRELVDEIFRTVHSLKAVAAGQQMKELTSLTQEFESVLHSLRNGRIQLDDEVLSVFEETVDRLFATLTEARDPDSSLVARLRKLTAAPAATVRAETGILENALPVGLWQSLTEHEKHRLQESVAEGASVYLVSTNFDVNDFDRQFHNLKNELSRDGELISTAPAVGENVDRINFRILYTRHGNLQQMHSELRELKDVFVHEVLAVGLPAAESTTITGPLEGSDYIRVSVADVDHLISSAYELARRFDEQLGKAVEAYDEFQPIVADLRRSLLELASNTVRLRLIPLRGLLQRALRAGRTASRASGKEIDFKISGEELSLDKVFCDAVADPLIHLVRNAVDHGIEEPGEREKLGKPRRGQIAIKATSSQGQTRISVTDDGRGIDPHFISEAAVRLGLIGQTSPLDLEQSLRMILRPGFSTATSVSETSGRGIGLDVVETSMERLGGEVRISSKTGTGSTFELHLPREPRGEP